MTEGFNPTQYGSVRRDRDDGRLVAMRRMPSSRILRETHLVVDLYEGEKYRVLENGRVETGTRTKIRLPKNWIAVSAMPG